MTLERQSDSSRAFFSVTHIVAVQGLLMGQSQTNSWGELTTTWSYLVAAKIYMTSCEEIKIIYEVNHTFRSTTFCNCSSMLLKYLYNIQPFVFMKGDAWLAKDSLQLIPNAKHSPIFHDSLVVLIQMVMIVGNET